MPVSPGLVDIQVNGFGGVDFENVGLRFLVPLSTDGFKDVVHLLVIRATESPLKVEIAPVRAAGFDDAQDVVFDLHWISFRSYSDIVKNG